MKGIDVFVKILGKWRRKEGRKEVDFRSLEVRSKLIALKKIKAKGMTQFHIFHTLT